MDNLSSSDERLRYLFEIQKKITNTLWLLRKLPKLPHRVNELAVFIRIELFFSSQSPVIYQSCFFFCVFVFFPFDCPPFCRPSHESIWQRLVSIYPKKNHLLGSLEGETHTLSPPHRSVLESNCWHVTSYFSNLYLIKK